MKRYFEPFARNIEAGSLLENLLVSAVSSLLVIRAFLSLTGYPRLGGRYFHVAHMLWGGLFMLVANVILLTFLNREALNLASIVGGIGFGMFIDELGKFITSDNNYFYQPSIALIYAIFVVLFLAFRAIERFVTVSEREYAVNALESLKVAVTSDLDEAEKSSALLYLARSDPNDPVVIALRELFASVETIEVPRPNRVARVTTTLRAIYGRLIRLKLFNSGIILFFVVISLVSAVTSIFSIARSASFVDRAELLSALVAGLFVVMGIYYMLRNNRLSAYRLFHRSVLVNIFFTQLFAFYRQQLLAVTGLLVYLLILLSLRYVMRQEADIPDEGAEPEEAGISRLFDRRSSVL
jgi:hypothetical protein